MKVKVCVYSTVSYRYRVTVRLPCTKEVRSIGFLQLQYSSPTHPALASLSLSLSLTTNHPRKPQSTKREGPNSERTREARKFLYLFPMRFSLSAPPRRTVPIIRSEAAVLVLHGCPWVPAKRIGSREKRKRRKIR